MLSPVDARCVEKQHKYTRPKLYVRPTQSRNLQHKIISMTHGDGYLRGAGEGSAKWVAHDSQQQTTHVHVRLVGGCGWRTWTNSFRGGQHFGSRLGCEGWTLTHATRCQTVKVRNVKSKFQERPFLLKEQGRNPSSSTRYTKGTGVNTTVHTEPRSRRSEMQGIMKALFAYQKEMRLFHTLVGRGSTFRPNAGNFFPRRSRALWVSRNKIRRR